MATMSKKQKVYFGPSSEKYSGHDGELAANTTVNVKWAEKLATSNEVWYYITFGTGNSKWGYVPAGSVKNAGTVGNPLVLEMVQRYMHADCPVYYSALSTSAKAGSVSYGESIQFLNKKEGSNPEFAFIEYQVERSTMKKRGWVDTNKIGMRRITPTLTVGQHPSDQNIKGAHYYGQNWYYTSDAELEGECTWYCWGRAHEKCGRYLTFNVYNAGKDWYDYCDLERSGVTQSPVPVTNSVCSCKKTNGRREGHVIFVELVKDGVVYYTEANVKGTDGIVKTCPLSEFPSRDGWDKVFGYIVL